jgi:threonine dehydratase
MTSSLKVGSAQTISNLNTIADSLAPPMTTPYCFSICQQFLDDVVLVSDDEIAAAASILFEHVKLGVEPAGAVSTAAAFGPLKSKLVGKRVALIVCGANIDLESFHQLIMRGQSAIRNNVLSTN